MTKSIFVVGKAYQVFDLEFFRSIANNVGMLGKVQHFKVIEIISDAQSAFLVNTCSVSYTHLTLPTIYSV